MLVDDGRPRQARLDNENLELGDEKTRPFGNGCQFLHISPLEAGDVKPTVLGGRYKIDHDDTLTVLIPMLHRDPADQKEEGQVKGFVGETLPAGAKLWSKAGWTSTTRHDVAYIELPNGSKFVLATFTTDHANEREIIPTVARVVDRGGSARQAGPSRERAAAH